MALTKNPALLKTSQLPRHYGRLLLKKFPQIQMLVLAKPLAPLRHLIYRAWPAIAKVVARRFLIIGDLDANAAAVDGVVRARLDEIDNVLESGISPDPSDQSKITNDRGTIIHALENSLPLDQTGYTIRSQAILDFQQQAGLEVHAYTRPGYPFDLGRNIDGFDGHMVASGNVEYGRLDPDCRLLTTGTEKQYIANYARSLCKVADRHDTAIVHAHSSYFG